MREKKVTVLVTGVGDVIGITVVKALRQSSLTTRIIGTDMKPFAAGFFFTDDAYVLPAVSDPTYLDKLTSLCKNELIDIAFIGSEPELRFLVSFSLR